MNTLPTITFAQKVKSYISSWKPEATLFLYEPYFYSRKSSIVLVLLQKNTGISLSMQLQVQDDSLRVTTFTLKENDSLKGRSPILNDFALLEIVLKAIALISFSAHSLNRSDVVLLLSQEDADHITSLNNLFESTSSVMTIEGKRKLLTLSTRPYLYETFLEQTDSIQGQLHQKLWALQKDDRLVMKYLQNLSQNKKIDLGSFLIQPSPLAINESIIDFSKKRPTTLPFNQQQ